MEKNQQEKGLGELAISALRMWAHSNPRRMAFYTKIAWRIWQADRRRIKNKRKIGSPIPSVLAISPTMHCNYNCIGCYSRNRKSNNELSTQN
jgi:sulfatase maturation enzyme AslB (radical SAM superfamily)